MAGCTLQVAVHDGRVVATRFLVGGEGSGCLKGGARGAGLLVIQSDDFVRLREASAEARPASQPKM
jgi:hypothetical protein